MHHTGANAIPLGQRRDEQDDQHEKETMLRVWVAHSDCAKIIGKGGHTMRELEAKSRTKLKVQREDDMDTQTKARFVEIVGSRSEQKAALTLILDLATYCREDGGEVLQDVRASDPQRKTEPPHVIEVLPEEVGRILGRKGDTVKLLEKDSNTKIEVDKKTGRLEIYGHKEAQEQALKLLLSEISYAKAEDGTVLKDQPRQKQKDDIDDLPPYKLWVKDTEAGRVIGRGGETIRDVMDKTGAEIKVQKSGDMRPGSTEREIRIFGPKEQQEQALESILTEVTWAKSEQEVLKAPRQKEQRAREERRHRKQQQNDKEKEKEKNENQNRDIGKAIENERNKEKSEEDGNESKKMISKKAPGTNSGLWVCATCGGDHRTKECPHTTNILGVGLHIGMQMGMQAMGVQSMQIGMNMVGTPLVPMMPTGGLPSMLHGSNGLQRTSSESSHSSSSGCDLSSACASSPRQPVERDMFSGRPRPTGASEWAFSRGHGRIPGGDRGQCLRRQALEQSPQGQVSPSRKRRRRQVGEANFGRLPSRPSKSPDLINASSAAPRCSGATPSSKKDRVDAIGL